MRWRMPERHTFLILCLIVGVIPKFLLTPWLLKAVKFLNFFVGMINNIGMNIVPSLSPLITCSSQPTIPERFSPITLQDLTNLVNRMKISSCPPDILPTSLFKSVIGSIVHAVLSIINCSLLSGQGPAQFKWAVIQPLIKKTNTYPSLPQNYRPISKLPFLSRIWEKVVVKQLTTTIDEHNILDEFQSGSRRLQKRLFPESQMISSFRAKQENVLCWFC